MIGARVKPRSDAVARDGHMCPPLSLVLPVPVPILLMSSPRSAACHWLGCPPPPRAAHMHVLLPALHRPDSTTKSPLAQSHRTNRRAQGSRRPRISEPRSRPHTPLNTVPLTATLPSPARVPLALSLFQLSHTVMWGTKHDELCSCLSVLAHHTRAGPLSCFPRAPSA